MRKQEDRTRYGVRLYALRSRIDALGLRQIPSKLDEWGYWKSETKMRNSQYFAGTLMNPEYLTALEKFVNDKEKQNV